MSNNSRRKNFLKSISNRAKGMTNRVRKMSNRMSNKAKNATKRMSNRAKGATRRMSNGIRNSSQKLKNRMSRKKRNNRRNKRPNNTSNNRRSGNNRGNNRRNNRGNNRMNRNMKGGAIEYSPLPCDANGNTDFDSTLQVGHETCVEYGTQGAEQDARAAGLGAGNLSSMNITDTIKDAVDQQLRDLMKGLDGQSNEAVRKALQERATGLGGSQGNTGAVQGAMDPEVSKQAYQLAQQRLAAQNQTTSVQ